MTLEHQWFIIDTRNMNWGKQTLALSYVSCLQCRVLLYIRIKGVYAGTNGSVSVFSALFRKYRTLAFIQGRLSCVHFICYVYFSLEQWLSSYCVAAVEQKYKWPQCLLSRETSSLQLLILCSRICNLWKSSVVSLATSIWPLVDRKPWVLNEACVGCSCGIS